MSKTKKSVSFPTAFLLISLIMLFFIVASWIGAPFSKEVHSIGILDIFTSIWRGFVERAEVILFIFSVGGTLGIMSKIKAIDNGINALSERLRK